MFVFVFAHRLVLLYLRVRQCWLSAVRGEVVGDGGVEGWICSGVYVEKAEKVVLRFELCGALSRSLMMGPTSPSLFGVLAPHTGLQDDTQRNCFDSAALSSSLTPSPSRDKPVTVAAVRRLIQQSGACET